MSSDPGVRLARRAGDYGGTYRSLLCAGVADAVVGRIRGSDQEGTFGGPVRLDAKLSTKAGELEFPTSLDAGVYWELMRQGRRARPDGLFVDVLWDEFSGRRDEEQSHDPDEQDFWATVADVGVVTDPAAVTDRTLRLRGLLILVACGPGPRVEIVSVSVVRHPWLTGGVGLAFKDLAVKQRLAGLAAVPVAINILNWNDARRRSRAVALRNTLVAAENPDVVRAYASEGIAATLSVVEENLPGVAWTALPDARRAIARDPVLGSGADAIRVSWGCGLLEGSSGVVLRIEGGRGTDRDRRRRRSPVI